MWSAEVMPSTSTIQHQLEAAMRKSVSSASSTRSDMETRNHDEKLDVSIKAEMAVFESSGKRGRSLEQAYKYLLTVPPTSVEVERAFLAAGVRFQARKLQIFPQYRSDLIYS